MVVARRLLMGGGGSFVQPHSITLTSAPQGGWTTPPYPKAVYYNGKTYLGWISGTGTAGSIYVAEYVHSTQTLSTPYLIDTPGVDTHNSPAILVRDSDKRLLVAFSQHDGPKMFLSTSTNPEDATAFGAPADLDAQLGSSDYTYPALAQLTGVAGDPIYLMYRDISGTTGRFAYSVSTDGGSTWATRTLLFSGPSTRVPYWNLTSDATTIHIMTTDRETYGGVGTLSVGHCYIDGVTGNVYKSDGTQIVAAQPFGIPEMTAVYDGSEGSCFIMDGDLSGDPIFTLIVAEASTISGRHCRWTGSAWDINEIYNAPYHPVDRYFGSAAINKSDTAEVFAGIADGGGDSEMTIYRTGDGGATWGAGQAITTASGNLNCAPIGVVSGASGLPVVWLNGDLTSSTAFSFGIKGLRRG